MVVECLSAHAPGQLLQGIIQVKAIGAGSRRRRFGKPLTFAAEVLKLRRDAGDGSAIELEMRPRLRSATAGNLPIPGR